MNFTSLHDRKLDMDYIAIPYFCIILSVFAYMLCQCNVPPERRQLRRELYMKV